MDLFSAFIFSIFASDKLPQPYFYSRQKGLGGIANKLIFYN